MESFVCIFCPAVVAFLVFEKKMGKKFDIKYSLLAYLLVVMILYVVSLFVCRFVFGLYATPEILNTSPIFAFKYVIVATVLGAALSALAAWLKMNVELKIVVKKEKKKNGKAKKRS